MGGMYLSGAVYNWHLHKLMDTSTEDLQLIHDDWAKKPWWRKALSYANLLVDWEMKLKAVNDLIVARGDPTSEIAQRIDPMLADWRAEDRQVAAA